MDSKVCPVRLQIVTFEADLENILSYRRRPVTGNAISSVQSLANTSYPHHRPRYLRRPVLSPT